MKKTYISPFVLFEDIETEGLMLQNSRWDVNGSNAAGDNDYEHGGGLGGNGGGGYDPTEPPEEGD